MVINTSTYISTVLEYKSFQQKEDILNGLKSLLFSFLKVYDPESVQFSFLDPVERGQTFAEFLCLADINPTIISNSVKVIQEDIDNELHRLNRQADRIIQSCLRKEFSSIYEYNKNSSLKEPIRILIIADYPNKFSEKIK